MAVHDCTTAGAAQDAGEQVGAGFAAWMLERVFCGSERGGCIHDLLDFFEEGAGDGGGAIILEEHVTILQGADIDGVAEEGDV